MMMNEDSKLQDKTEMNKKRYKDIVNSIINQAPMECGVQSLVYTMLYDIIRDKYKDNEVDIIVADLRNKHSIFCGFGGVIDLCIVSKEFRYKLTPLTKKDIDQYNEYSNDKQVRILKKYDYWEKQKMLERNLSNDKKVHSRQSNLEKWNNELKKEFEENKARRWGCVEVKAVGVDLPDNIWQLAGHIIEYKRVLYTNGLKWQFFDLASLVSKENEDYIKEFISAFVKYNMILNMDKNTNQEIKDACEQLKEIIYKEDRLKKWECNLGNDNQFLAEYDKNIMELKENISAIEWEELGAELTDFIWYNNMIANMEEK